MTEEQDDFGQSSLTNETTLPAKLSKIKKADDFPALKYRWNNNEEVLSFLISFDNHGRWISFSTKKRPENGSMLLYNRNKSKDYRKDGYLWKKRKCGNTAREDHFKLKVAKIECLNALYTHSALVPTFHRRCYWLLENPDIILVHYLNSVEECTTPQTVTMQARVSNVSKADISHQLDTIYSGVSDEVKPHVQVTEDTSTDLMPSSESNDKAKGRRPLNGKVFTISITPRIKQRLKGNLATCGNGNGGRLGSNKTNHVVGNLCDDDLSWGNTFDDPRILAARFNLPASLPSLFPECISCNSRPQTQGTFPCSSSCLSTCGSASTSQQAQPMSSSGLSTCNPIGGSASTSQQAQPISSSGLSTCNPIGGSASTSQQAQPISSSGLFTCSPIGVSASTSQQAQPISSSGLSTCNPIVGSASTSQQAQPISSPGLFTCNPIGGSSGTLRQTQPIRSTGVSTSGNIPTTIAQPVHPNLPVYSFGLQAGTSLTELSRANSPVVILPIRTSGSCAASHASKPVAILPKPWQEEPHSVSDTQINAQSSPLTDSALNGLNTNAMPAANMSRSPSSDYGSYVSDLSNNVSVEGLREGLYDGPFRVPHPIGQESNRNSQSLQQQRLLSARRGSVTESSGSSGSSSSRSSSHDTSQAQQLHMNTDSISHFASSTDSDAGIDLTDLQDFTSFDVLDVDLCLNFPSDSFTDTGSFSVEEASMSDLLGQNANFPENRVNFPENSRNFPENSVNFQEQNRIYDLFQSQLTCDTSLAPSHGASASPVALNLISMATAKQGNNCSGAPLNTCSDTPLIFPSAVASHFVTTTAHAGSEASKVSQFYGSNTSSSHTTPSQGLMDVNMVDVQVSQPVQPVRANLQPVHNRFTTTSDVQSGTQSFPTQSENVNRVSGNHNDSSSFAPRTPGHTVPVSARITEYSPDWSYPEGGTKVLVTGEWSVTQGTFTCLFDGCSVHATLIHPGVLRCFCPSHEPGLVTLQVACNGFIVSNACVFEYRTRDTPTSSGASCHEWLAKDDTRFKLAILDRLERLEQRLEARLSSVTTCTADVGQIQHSLELEDRLVKVCTTLFRAAQVDAGAREREKPYRGLTLLHLSAALGFSSLVVRLLRCRQETKSEAIKEELDPLRKDAFSCTPLMWACALGQTDTVMALLEHEPDALLLADARGRLPLQIARDRGYNDVVQSIEDFVMASPQRQILLFGNYLEEAETPACPLESFSRESSPMSALSMSPLSGPPSNDPSEPMSVESRTSECASEDPGSVPTLGRVSICRANTLGKALTEVRSMINKAEQEAEREQAGTPGWSHRVCGQLSSLRETSELVTSPCSWKTAGGIRSFSSTSSQASPVSSRSSLSPGSPGFLGSPHSSTSRAPDTTEFEEFIASSRRLLERDFSDLTLTDREQRELYEAAKIIQHAYRNYKVRCHQQEQEIQAAILIQHQYRRYKQYVVTKKKTHAARIIQNQFRAHREHEHFQKSRRAAAIIQSHFRIYRERRRSQRRRDERKYKRHEARFMQQFCNRSKEGP